MHDLLELILFPLIGTVLGGLILSGIYLVLKYLKTVMKEKWKDRDFRLRILLWIGIVPFVFGNFFILFLAPIEVAIPVLLISIGSFVLLTSFIYMIGLGFESRREEIDSLTKIVTGLFLISSEVPKEDKQKIIDLKKMQKILTEMQNKSKLKNNSK
ncbi:MAG: hypothetical protein HWN65_08420 [Candidatus Helarchaeota archaeon]|nr:hypothetical protein [Candidatus Helarchaeota archaeon]